MSVLRTSNGLQLLRVLLLLGLGLGASTGHAETLCRDPDAESHGKEFVRDMRIAMMRGDMAGKRYMPGMNGEKEEKEYSALSF